MEIFEGLENILVPIFICVVLPVTIVYIIYRTRQKRDANRTAILLEAIRSNSAIDTDKLTESVAVKKRTPRELLNLRLLRGCIFSLVGVVLILLCPILTLIEGSDLEAISFMLLAGGICLAIGISYLIVYFTSRKQFKDAEAEEATEAIVEVED